MIEDQRTSVEDESMCSCWQGWLINCCSSSESNDQKVIKGTKPAKSSQKTNPSVQRMSSDDSKTSSCQIGDQPHQNLDVRIFTYNELKVATRNFRPDSAVGEGGFGVVYKGWIDAIGPTGAKVASGVMVAVKALNQEGLQGHKEWLTEVNYLGQLHHPHLVKLIGYACENEHRLLVYEYMQRGSLENHLFRKAAIPLPWATRMKIAFGAAKGLAFLHGAEKPVIYRDFKTSNILLDSEYTAKLSDFGLIKDGPQDDQTHVSCRVSPIVICAPEYVMTGHLTCRSDVYSFGVVLLELLTGRRSVDKTRPTGEQNLVEWARPFLCDSRRLMRLVDPRLDGQYSVKGAQKAANLALHCLCPNPKSRPLMSDVVITLEPLQNMTDAASASYTYIAESGTVASTGQQRPSSHGNGVH